MNIMSCFPSKYVKAHDLNGRDVTVTIREVRLEELGQPPKVEERPVVYFEKATKGLILNKTNSVTIAGLYGAETNDWIGKAITLYPTRVKAFGALHDVIRIRDRRPTPAQAAAETDTLDDPEDIADPEDIHEEVGTASGTTAQAVDHPFDDSNPIGQLLTELDNLGSELYGEQWPSVRRRNAERISDGATAMAAELGEADLRKLVNGLKKLKRERAQRQAA